MHTSVHIVHVHVHVHMYMFTCTHAQCTHLHQLVKSVLISISQHHGENSRLEVRGQSLSSVHMLLEPALNFFNGILVAIVTMRGNHQTTQPKKLTSIRYHMPYDIESRTGRSSNRARKVVPTLELHLDSSCKADTDEKCYMYECYMLVERMQLEHLVW